MQNLKNRDEAVVVFSGGQDSTTCLLWALKKYKKVYAVSFDYGQKHIKELECAKKIAEKFGVTGNSLVLIGITAVIGHTFSPFLNFKGGKGVATSLGIFLYLAPIPMLITLLMFFVVVGITKYVSLGSVLASVMLPLLILFIPVNEKSGNKAIVFIISALLGTYIIYKHKANIQRLKNGTENKFYKK